MKATLALLASGIMLACIAPASAASQYETLDYYVQQMIAHAAANDATGVGTFQEQLEQLRRPEAGDSAKARPYQQQGLEHLGRNNLKQALAAFRQAFIADPIDPEIAGHLGMTYLRLRRFKESERLAVYTLSLAPTQSATWSVLGETYGQTGDAPRAAGAFVNAYRFAKNPPQIVERLRQLAAADPETLRAGARQALDSIRPPADSPAAASSSLPTPTEKPTAPPGPTPPTNAAAPAGASSAGPAPAAGPAALSAVLGSLKRGVENFSHPPAKATSETGAPRAAGADSPGQRIYRRASPLTCLIVTFRNGRKDSLGSGLLVSPDGLVITNHHVIDKADNLAVRCGEQESAASVRGRSRKPDLALLATALKSAESFALNESYDPNLIGRDIFVIGNPYGLEGTFSTGVISGLREIDGVRYIQISAPVSPGNSGGPVILGDGTVIGIAAMGLKAGQNLNFAIASTEVIASRLFDPERMKSQPLAGPQF